MVNATTFLFCFEIAANRNKQCFLPLFLPPNDKHRQHHHARQRLCNCNPHGLHRVRAGRRLYVQKIHDSIINEMRRHGRIQSARHLIQQRVLDAADRARYDQHKRRHNSAGDGLQAVYYVARGLRDMPKAEQNRRKRQSLRVGIFLFAQALEKPAKDALFHHDVYDIPQNNYHDEAEAALHGQVAAERVARRVECEAWRFAGQGVYDHLRAVGYRVRAKGQKQTPDYAPRGDILPRAKADIAEAVRNRANCQREQDYTGELVYKRLAYGALIRPYDQIFDCPQYEAKKIEQNDEAYWALLDAMKHASPHLL